METRRATYTLARIEHSSSPAFAAALAIYVQLIPPSLRTDTNEIAHWLDRYEACFGDPLLLFSFSVRNRVVGFSQVIYLRAEQVAIIDYLVLDAQYRKNNTFFEFAEQIREYFRAKGWPLRWAAAEVGAAYHPRPDADSALLIRLLKLEGFRVAKAPYYQPLLSIKDLESEQPAVLLLAGDPALRRIRRETYLDLVSTIYVKHYLRWYSIYPGEEQQLRSCRVQALEKRIASELAGKRDVELNGYESVLAHADDAASTSTAERNLATQAVRVAIVLVLALAGGTLPDPFRLAVWAVLGVGILVAILVWPNPRWRRILWREVRFSRRRE